MRRRISLCVRVAPIPRIWEENYYSYLWLSQHPVTRNREENLRRALRDVTTLISFEEVFGCGLLARFEASQPPAVTR